MDWICFVLIVFIVVIAEKMLERKILPLKVHFEYLSSTIRNHHNEILTLNTRLKTNFSSIKKQQNVISKLQNEFNKICSTLINQKDVISRLRSQLELKHSSPKTKPETQISIIENKLENKTSDSKILVQPIRTASQEQLEAQMPHLGNKCDNNPTDSQFQMETIRPRLLNQMGSALENKIDKKVSDVEVRMESIHDQLANIISALYNKLDIITKDLQDGLESFSSSSKSRHDFVKMTTSDLHKQIMDVNTGLQKEITNVETGLQKQITGNERGLRKEMTVAKTGLQKQITTTETRLQKQIAGAERGLQEQINHTETVLQNQISDAETVVAFTARVQNDVKGFNIGEIVPFGAVVTNISEAYNPDTSVFICPLTGLYHFSWTILSDNGTSVDTDLCVSGKWKLTTFSSGTTYNSSSASGVLHLKEGEDVCVKIGSGLAEYAKDTNISSLYSSFSGHLIRKM